MRRLAALTALAALLALSGCGGGHREAATPLDDALGYFAKDAPLVLAIETDRDGTQLEQLASLVGRFPGSEVFVTRLQNLARLRFANWERDVQPQLGAPLVVGLVKPAAGADLSVATIVAMRVKHPLEAKQLLLRQPGFRGHGKESGVRIYENTTEHRYVAVDGDTVVAGTNRDILAQALAMRRSQNRMRAGGFAADLKGLPTGGFARISADPRTMIGADPRLRPAVGVKWIASMRRLGGVLDAGPDGISADFRIATDKGSLSDADLPFATGSQPVQLMGNRDEVQVGIREPDRLARLALQIWHAIAPTRSAALKLLEPRGVDLDRQIPHHLTGPLAAAFNPFNGRFALRSGLTEASDVRDALTVLAPALPGLAALFGIKGLGLATPATGENFYALAKPNGRTAVFGVLGNSLVAASEAQRAADLASESTRTAGAARGGLGFFVNGRELAGELLARRIRGPAGLLAPLAVASLRDLTGGLTITRDGLRAHAKLTIVK